MKTALTPRLILIFAVVFCAAIAVYFLPLRLGIDLAGGTSLLYELDIKDPKANSADLAQQVIEVLKKRVDPYSQKNMIWRVVGGKRIQIQMPLPDKATLAARDDHNRALAALQATVLRTSQVESVLTKTGAARDAEIERVAPVGSARHDLLIALAKANDELNAIKAQKDAVDPDKVTESVRQQFYDATNKVLAAREALRLADVDVEKFKSLLSAAENPKNKDAQTLLVQFIADHPEQKAQIQAVIDTQKKLMTLSGGGVDDPNDLKRMLTASGVLDFRVTLRYSELGMSDSRDPTGQQNSPDLQTALQNLDTLGPDHSFEVDGMHVRWFEIDPNGEDNFKSGFIVAHWSNGRPYVLCFDDYDHALTHDPKRKPWAVTAGSPNFNPGGVYAMPFTMDNVGAKYMDELTSANKGRNMAILLDNRTLTAPTIQSTISESGEITFGLASAGHPIEAIKKEADDLKQIMDAGSLPATLQQHPISEVQISPDMGEDNISAGLQSAYYAIGAVVGFMLLYYTITGFFADAALMLNLLLVLATMAAMQGTFTLPGIAGLVLTLGMAVDANVLINERIREELHKGASLWMAIKQGYDRVFWTIFDANLTTSLTSIVLIMVGSEEVKGFGITLLIGLIIHMFTALFVTRTFMMAGVRWGLIKAIDDHSLAEYIREIVTFTWLRNGHFPFMRVITVSKIDWIGKRHIFWILSAVVMTAGLVAFIARGDDKYDIEFRGGTQVTMQLSDPLQDLESVVIPLASDPDAVKKHPDLPALSDDLKNQTADHHLSIAQARQAIDSLASDADMVKANPKIPLVQKQLAGLKEIAYLSREDVEARVLKLSDAPGLADLKAARVYGAGRPGEHRWEIETTINNTPVSFHKALEAQFPPAFAAYLDPSKDMLYENTTLTFTLHPDAKGDVPTLDQIRAKVAELAKNEDLKELRDSRIEIVGSPMDHKFQMYTGEIDIQEKLLRPLAIAFKDSLDIMPKISIADSTASSSDLLNSGMIRPIKTDAKTLSEVFAARNPGLDYIPVVDLQDYRGGAAIVLKDINPPQTAAQLTERLRSTRLSPEISAKTPNRNFKVVPVLVSSAAESPATAATTAPSAPAAAQSVRAEEDDTRPLSEAVLLVGVETNQQYDDRTEALWRETVADSEWTIVQAAIDREILFPGVTSFDPVVAGQAKQSALIAIIVSLILIVVYVWIRFGGIWYGIGAIVSLAHDAIVALAATVLSGVAYYYLFHSHSFLLITDFKINLTMIAAYLTVIGYSVNDTIVIFDRVRELRGKSHSPLTAQLVNDAINQCFGRTIWTTFTVFIVVLIMYIWGGPGVRGFSFAMLIGVITGAYSTLAIASPMLLTTSRVAERKEAGLTRVANPFLRQRDETEPDEDEPKEKEPDADPKTAS